MKRKNILFISLNRHQRRYFALLSENLSVEYNTFHVHYGAANLTDLFHKCKLVAEVEELREEIPRIIHFMLIKAQYRRLGYIRQWLYSKEILTSQACAAINYFYKYIFSNKIDLVCMWNGTLVPLASAAKVAQKLNRRTLFFENGYLPQTTTIDQVGVNYLNSITGKSPLFFEAIRPDYDKLDAIFQTPQNIRQLKTKWYHQLLKRNPKGSIEQVKLPEKYVFLPFQVHDDTQVLLHSPVIKKMDDLLNMVVSAVAKHNNNTGDDVWVIAKEHPSDFGRIDYSGLKETFKQEKLIFLRHYPTPELIKQSYAVITINSTVGIEALVQHKPVITVGNAFYNVPGVVVHTTDTEELKEILLSIYKRIDFSLVDKFLYYLRYHYLAEGSWRIPDEKHIQSVKHKVEAALENPEPL